LRAGDRGAGSVLVVAVASALLLTVAAFAPVSLVLSAKRVAGGAADAAALAAADAAIGLVAGPPCTRAAEVAAANGATLSACQADGAVVTVRVTVEVAGLAIASMATAGPSPGRPTK